MKRSPITAVAIAFILSCSTTTVSADDRHDHSSHQHGAAAAKTQHGPHGGELAYAAAIWHEVVFRPDGVRVFLYDAKGQPVDVGRIAGQITMTVDGNPKPYTYALRPDTARGAATNALHLALDLSKVPDGRMQTQFSISGIPGQAQPAQFAQRFHLTRSAAELAIAQQKICPVSGKALGSMGAPPAVRIGDRDVYVCCAGCTKALEREPAKFLAMLPTPPAAKATQADMTAVSVQKLCPVMNEPLMSMGGAWKMYAKGQPVFVCCKGCIAKVEKHPDFYLAKATRQTSATPANGRR